MSNNKDPVVKAAYDKIYYRKNLIEIKRKRKVWEEKTNYFKNRTLRVKRRYHWIGKYKIEKGCELCGYNAHKAPLQFDHINPSEKYKMISHLMYSSLKILIDEIRKCRVLCANCHEIHTHNQRSLIK